MNGREVGMGRSGNRGHWEDLDQVWTRECHAWRFHRSSRLFADDAGVWHEWRRNRRWALWVYFACWGRRREQRLAFEPLELAVWEGLARPKTLKELTELTGVPEENLEGFLKEWLGCGLVWVEWTGQGGEDSRRDRRGRRGL